VRFRRRRRDHAASPSPAAPTLLRPQVLLRVSAKAKTAAAAREEAARAAAAVQAALAAQEGVTVTTTDLSLQQTYDWNQTSQENVPTGYEFSQSMRAKIEGVTPEKLGAAVDAAVAAGGAALQVQGVSAELGPAARAAAAEEARALAVKDALAGAATLAAAAGVDLGPIVSLVDGSAPEPGPPMPFAPASAAMDSAAAKTPTPVPAVEDVEVVATVTAGAAFCNK
jgi:uncharacterized protein YggE